MGHLRRHLSQPRAEDNSHKQQHGQQQTQLGQNREEKSRLQQRYHASGRVAGAALQEPDNAPRSRSAQLKHKEGSHRQRQRVACRQMSIPVGGKAKEGENRTTVNEHREV